MRWWSLEGFSNEIMGDAPADVAADAFAKLCALRARTERPPLRYEDITALLLAAVARAGRDISPRKHCKLEGLMATFRDGSPEVRHALGVVPVAPDELTITRDLLHRVAATYRTAVDRRPTMHEALAIVVFVLRRAKASYLAPDDTRELDDLRAIYEDDRGQLTAEELLATVAATMRRNERRLGLLAQGGESLQPKEVLATTKDGRDLRAVCATAKAPSTELVDDVSARLDAIAKEHQSLLSLEGVADALLSTFRQAPERFAELASLRIVTAPRAAEGRPSAGARAALAAPPPDAGPRVRHPKFGEGTVLRLIDDGQKKYEIAFDDGPTKTLLARFVEELG